MLNVVLLFLFSSVRENCGGWLTYRSSYSGVRAVRLKIGLENTDHDELLCHKSGIELTL